MTFARSLPRILGRHQAALGWAGVIVGIVLTGLVLSTPWGMTDGVAYQLAGGRLRDGEPLYPAGSQDAASVYRYSPWFALIWMLPIPDVAWLAAMAICAVAAVVPGITAGGWRRGLAALVFPYLLLSAMGGNVQPAMIAVLVYGVGTGAGPIAIAIAASLKGFPLLYTLVYVGRREWGRAAVSLAATAVLTLPIFLFDLASFPLSTEGSWSLFEWAPILWGAVCLGLVGYVLVRPSWLAGSLLSMLARTKFVFYDVSYLLVGLGHRTDHRVGTTGPVAGSR